MSMCTCCTVHYRPPLSLPSLSSLLSPHHSHPLHTKQEERKTTKVKKMREKAVRQTEKMKMQSRDRFWISVIVSKIERK